MLDYRSPFIVGRPVLPERFIGREKEAKAILHRLTGPAPDNTAVSGEALIGKTSLLHYIASPEIAEKWGLSTEKCTFIFVDSQTIVPFSLVEFWRYVLRSLAAREGYDPGYIADLLQGDDIGSFELGEFFDRVARDGKLVVLLLDEFEHIVEYVNPDDPQFLYLLRALINRPAYGLALVLASRKPLEDLCQNLRFVGSPFMTSFISLSLGPFSPEEADTLIDVYTQGTGVTFSDRDREFAYEISKGHPYSLQKTCFRLFQRHKEKVRMSDEQPSPLGDPEYREITEEIAEETKEPDGRLSNSPRSNFQAARSSVITEWLIARSSGVLDEIIAGLIMAGILYVFGVISGILEGAPIAWLASSRSTWYLVGSIPLIVLALIAYVAWQRKRR